MLVLHWTDVSLSSAFFRSAFTIFRLSVLFARHVATIFGFYLHIYDSFSVAFILRLL